MSRNVKATSGVTLMKPWLETSVVQQWRHRDVTSLWMHFWRNVFESRFKTSDMHL